MEMQLFILGHVILFGVCCVGSFVFAATEHDNQIKIPIRKWKTVPEDEFWTTFWAFTFITFIPLETIYWGLHWWLVP